MDKRIWTPGGDVPVGDEPPESAGPAPGPEAVSPPGPDAAGREPSEEELRQYLEQLRSIPVRDIIVNQAVSLYQVAAVHLQPDELEDAQLAIDAFEGLINAVDDRFGPAKPELDAILTQLRLDFVSVQKAAGAAPTETPTD